MIYENRNPQKKCQILHKQARDVIFKVSGYFKQKADSKHPAQNVTKCQESIHLQEDMSILDHHVKINKKRKR
jgi:hypothetical protein